MDQSTVFNPHLLESTYVKPRNTENQPYTYWKKNPDVSGPAHVKLILFKGQLYFFFFLPLMSDQRIFLRFKYCFLTILQAFSHEVGWGR